MDRRTRNEHGTGTTTDIIIISMWKKNANRLPPPPPPRSLFLLLLLLAHAPSCHAARNAPSSLPSPLLTPSNPCLNNQGLPTPVWQQLPLAEQGTCPRGFWCPNLNASDPSTYITVCPATDACQVLRLRNDFCPFQGLYDPVLCPSGYYCPGDGRTIVPCPEGTWCPYGNFEPLDCPPLTICPAKSSRSIRYAGLVAVAIVDGALALLWFLRRLLVARKLRSLPTSAHAQGPSGGKNNVQEMPAAVDGKVDIAISSPGVSTGATTGVSTGAAGGGGGSTIERLDQVAAASSAANAATVDNHLEEQEQIDTAGGSAQPNPTDAETAPSSPTSQPRGLVSRTSSRRDTSRLEVLQLVRSRGNLSAALAPAFEHARASAPTPHLAFRFDSLSLRIPMPAGPPKSVLASVTGALVPGKVTAIMGPSGAGKTTFLNTLMGKVSSTWQREGHLFINGVEEPVTKYKQFVGYVPQDDIMRREMTVRENIHYSAMMRLPADWTRRDKYEHVEACIQALGLAHISESAIGTEFERGISGGQRKRVSIGMELAAAPLALFLDEPTTGLDSTSAMEVCYMLRDIAVRTQLTVAMVIHQPRKEIWESLDDVLLLAPGGLTIYLGPQSLCERYFAEYLDVHLNPKDNPADALMDEIALAGADFAKAWTNGGESWMHKIDVAYQQRVEEEMLRKPTLEEDAMRVARLTNFAEDASVLAPDLEMQALNSSNVAATATTAAAAGPATAHQLSQRVVRTPERLAHRGAPFWQQLYLAFERSMVMQLSNLSSLVPETLTIVVVAAILGVAGIGFYGGQLRGVLKIMSSRPFEELVPETFYYVTLGVTLSGGVAGLRVHGDNERVVYWREASSGHSPAAYFIGLCTAQIWRCAVVALHFVAVFDVLSNGPISYGKLFLLVFLHFLVAYGIASIIAQFATAGNASIAVVLIGVVIAITNGFARLPEWLGRLFAPFYFTEAYVNASIDPFADLMTTESTRSKYGFRANNDAMDYGMMIVFAILYRLVGYVALVRMHREKQV